MVTMLDLASEKGFILERWIKVINIMTHKKPGACLIEKLRVIHLFEAGCNFIISTVFGRRAMHSGVDNNTLHQSQWAQPGRQCSEAVIVRELTLGVSKMTKTPLAGFANDALACYDRIAMNLVSAVFDRLGVPPGPVRLQEETLLLAVHCLKTGFGISTPSTAQATLSNEFAASDKAARPAPSHGLQLVHCSSKHKTPWAQDSCSKIPSAP